MQQGRPYMTALRHYADTAYGWAMDDTDSFVKLIADPDSRLLLGAHVMGPHALDAHPAAGAGHEVWPDG